MQEQKVNNNHDENIVVHRSNMTHSVVETAGKQFWHSVKHAPPDYFEHMEEDRVVPSAHVPDADRKIKLGETEERYLRIIRQNLPANVEIHTFFGKRRVTYADYTASGRPLMCIEEYLANVVGPLFANTHTETSATGLQTTHFREEARDIIMKGCGANRDSHELIFVGSGVTGAIEKFINIMDISVPFHLRKIVQAAIPLNQRPLILISDSEHHSNELMWRENYVELVVIPRDSQGELSIAHIRETLENHKEQLHERLVIGSFTAGSNVTGLRNNPFPIASLLHEYGALSIWDYAGAGAYVDINMAGDPNISNSHLDAIFLSPHKFVGGPGCPGVLIARQSCLPSTRTHPPSAAGGGTVQMVWHEGVIYDPTYHIREEAGTPQIVGAIRCGLVFRIREMVGPKRIEEIEGDYARRAVLRLQAAGVWVMGDDKANIKSSHRLSITSFNIPCPHISPNKFLHHHFVATIMNDLYGIQSRSGCSCAGPLGMLLFNSKMPSEFQSNVIQLTEDGLHAFKPGWCRVNFNYFISEDEFEFIVQAIEQIAKYGYKLLPLYALCLESSVYVVNTHQSFDRFDAVRLLSEFKFSTSADEVEWVEPRTSMMTFQQTLDQAKQIYDRAPELIAQMHFRARDYRNRESVASPEMESTRFFILASEVIRRMVQDGDLQLKADARAEDPDLNPIIAAPPQHASANPWYTRGVTIG